MKKYFFLSVAVALGALTMTSCGDDDDNKDGNETGFNIKVTTPIVDQDTYASVTTGYDNKAFGEAAIDGCAALEGELTKANSTISGASLSETQEAYLYKVLENVVSNVIVPTYTQLANETEALESTLNGLTVNTITQSQINAACEDFKKARQYWELLQQRHERRDAGGCYHPGLPRP